MKWFCLFCLILALQAGFCHPKLPQACPRACGADLNSLCCLQGLSGTAGTAGNGWEGLGALDYPDMSMDLIIIDRKQQDTELGLVSGHQFSFVFPSVPTCFHLLLAGPVMIKMSGPKSWIFPTDPIKCCWRNHLVFLLVCPCTYNGCLSINRGTREGQDSNAITIPFLDIKNSSKTELPVVKPVKSVCLGTSEHKHQLNIPIQWFSGDVLNKTISSGWQGEGGGKNKIEKKTLKQSWKEK